MNYAIWENGKLKHLELGDTAADDYDQNHHTTFGTGQYMRFEQEMLAASIKSQKPAESAIDIGSGTGRISLLLSKHFQNVFGYDFSPKSIEVARKKAVETTALNINFTAYDVDKNGLPHDASSVDFVCASFGMGSFFYSLGFLLSEIRRVLKPGGLFLLSFYNKNSLGYLAKELMSYEPSLAARIDPDHQLLTVVYNDTKYSFPVRPYSVKQVRSSVDYFLESTATYTYPVLPTILSEEALRSGNLGRDFETIDRIMSDARMSELGAYILSIGRKPNFFGKYVNGYPNSFQQIFSLELQNRVLLHEPILKSKDVHKLKIDDPSFVASNMAKTLIIATSKDDDPPLIAVCLRIDDKLDLQNLAVHLRLTRSQLRFATPEEIKQNLGFSPGAIPPYGLGDRIAVYADTALSKVEVIWCGTGSPIESIKLSLSDFKSVTNAKFLNLSRDSGPRL